MPRLITPQWNRHPIEVQSPTPGLDHDVDALRVRPLRESPGCTLDRIDSASDADGFAIRAESSADAERNHEAFTQELLASRLSDWVRWVRLPLPSIGYRYFLDPDRSPTGFSDYDTLGIGETLPALEGQEQSLRAEILVALLQCPRLIDFPSYDEFVSAIRLRQFIVENASKTSLEFGTGAVNRPPQFWTHDEENGFVLKSGRSLIEALTFATQPSVSGRRYGFSCYRATEYVILLAVAREAALTNPALLDALERQWKSRALTSERFQGALLQELGSNSDPLPPFWFVPGDRVWFRNPDDTSSDVTGYEGSWVIYLGRGRFSNFWQPDSPYDLTTKCLEIFYWRKAVHRGDDGELRIDEDEVARRIVATRSSPHAVAAILSRLLRLRDLQGIYAQGGCLDRTREFPRWVRPGTCNVALPSGGVVRERIA